MIVKEKIFVLFPLVWCFALWRNTSVLRKVTNVKILVWSVFISRFSDKLHIHLLGMILIPVVTFFKRQSIAFGYIIGLWTTFFWCCDLAA